MGLLSTIGAIASAAAFASANSDFVTLATRGSAWIQEADATVILPALPNPVNGHTSLWSGIYTDNNLSFMQGVSAVGPGDNFCGRAGITAWCNNAYTLTGQAPNWNVHNGKSVLAGPGAKVRTHYKLNPSTQLWDQNMYVNGKLVSTVSMSKGEHGNIFYISIECAAGDCAAHPAHYVSIVLNQPDMNFKHNGAWDYGATGGVMSTPDSGKTWNFTTLNMPAQKAQ
ncbi:hypothetical protein BDZ85DRAFT_321311 [Elsinoe ampelina]|uniref:Concanavalin A-like lectin/glucanase domain-containing protein n=1 Tax=Elsinoe ampelina TaxID=302913 RepID=A0A6A6G4N8_9PEZI|nr:hypothetical protein BDZ85DRAFT_321311 [Elsinoe ampelina]